MSTKKILFFAIGGILLLICMIVIFSMRNTTTKKPNVAGTLTIWITDGSTEEYGGIIEGFKAYAPEYKNTEIKVEKKTTDPIRYRTLLLNTLSDGTGPDIFMLKSGDDRILEGKRELIGGDVLSITDFENNYEDIFGSLLTGSTDANDTGGRMILGIPLGYETLGIFYNRSLLREIPKTWDEIEKLYTIDFGSQKFPTNLGLGPRYTPNASDIISLFVSEDGNSYSALNKSSKNLASYLNYRNIELQREVTEENQYAPKSTILSMIDSLEKDKKTTFDLFMQGDIAMILGYPSTIAELEKSTKRSGIDSIENLVLTAPIVQNSTSGKKRNIVRFPYLSISKETKNPYGAVKFLEYLMTDDGIRNIQKAYPYLIPPKPSLYESWKGKSLSKVLTKARIDPFIPELEEKLSVFDFGLHAEFDLFMSENIDRESNIDINNISTLLVSSINCGIELYLNSSVSTECEKKD